MKRPLKISARQLTSIIREASAPDQTYTKLKQIHASIAAVRDSLEDDMPKWNMVNSIADHLNKVIFKLESM